MSFIIEKFDSWNLNQSKRKEIFGISDSKMKCFPYRGLGHVLVDIIYGLKHFWPTRKSIIISTWGSPFISESIKGLLTEGFQITSLPLKERREQLETLTHQSKDILAVVLVRDHCVTGEILTQDEELKILNDKKIPFIEIQNKWAWTERSSLPHPFGAQVRVIDAQKVLTIFGGRFRFSSMSAAVMDWSHIEWENQIKELQIESKEDPHYTQKFEKEFKKFQDHFGLYFENSESRLNERLIFEVKGVDGTLFLENLLLHLNEPPLSDPGFEQRCETTNLSRWEGGYPCWSWWGESKLLETQQRSLVTFSISFLKKHSVSPEILNNIYMNCLKEIKLP